jgi:ribosomal protein S18 acetylase RimI-like enzyme
MLGMTRAPKRSEHARMNVRSLVAADFDRVHAAFVEAFSDYDVPLQLSSEQLREMLRRRGWSPEASVGVFDGERLVAFTLNGLGTWEGRPTGYDTGTGVVPSHRGRGLSRTMIDAAFALLREHGAEQYLLEVLQSNERAFGVYRAAGFEVTRALQCWSVASSAEFPCEIEVTDSLDLDLLAGWFDVRPSWQNGIESMRRAAAPRVHLAAFDHGELAGGAIAFENGDLPLLAVAPAHRRRGIGRALLAAASRARPLRIVNVDPAGRGVAAFLTACGAEKTVAQWEMVRRL